MKNLLITFCSLLCWILWTLPGHAQGSGAGYHIIDSLQLGGEGGWDYLTIDTSSERLYVSRGSRVQVVDLLKHVVIGEIPKTTGVHGIALARYAGRGYTSNGRDSSVTVFDLVTLQSLMTIRINGRNPDAILFDPFSKRIFTFNGGSANATVIDVDSNKVIGTVPLAGKPEFPVSDGRGRIFVNIEDKSSIAVIDATTLKVLQTWSVAPGEEPSGLAIDRAHKRLFSVCGNKMMVVVNTDSGNIVATLPIGDGVDGAAFDSRLGLAYSSNGEGTVTVVRADAPDKYAVVENAPSRRGARTMTIDERNHRLYTVSARFGPPPAPTPDRPHPRPSIEPGSVTLYILGR